MHNFPRKKVALVPVAGEYGKGKSFLLNFFHSYLANKDDWLNANAKLAKLFSFKQRGHEAHTKGILVWSEPFFAREPETGDELAVFLMDTQGSSYRSAVQDNATIFALSAMLSSTLVLKINNRKKFTFNQKI